jgi:signal peptidase I
MQHGFNSVAVNSQSEYKANWDRAFGRSTGRSVWYYLRLLVLALVLAFVIKESVVEAYRIPSESMENTLLVGDFLLANKFVYGAYVPFTGIRLPALREPRPGDVIVFRFPEDQRKSFVKRVIAVGGDTVEIINKVVMVNHRKIADDGYAVHFDAITIPKRTDQPRDNFGPLLVPESQYFVMGDNRDNSADSRYWGCVPRNLIVARAFMIHWSWMPDENAPAVNVTKPLSILNSIGYNIRHLATRVRWSRLFSSVN